MGGAQATGRERPARGGGAPRGQQDVASYVLHTYPYSESSLIVESFTRRHGRVPLLAKGAKRPRSALRGLLMQFQRVSLAWSGRGELKSLTHAEWMGGVPALGQTALFCGFYLNELLLKFLARDDPHERLFDCYEHSLMALASGARGADVLRAFEQELLREIGYAVNLRTEADSGALVSANTRYVYEPGSGMRRLRAGEHAELELTGAVALAIEGNDYSDPRAAVAAKHLMRHLIEYHLNGRQLATRRIFFALQQA